MDDLDREFEALQRVLEENAAKEVKNLWLVCFKIWRFYFLLNQRIANAKDITEQVAIIEKFISFYKGGFAFEAVVPQPQVDVHFDPHLHEILRLLDRERGTFGKNLRRIKAQRGGKRGVKKKAAPMTSKWMKS